MLNASSQPHLQLGWNDLINYNFCPRKMFGSQKYPTRTQSTENINGDVLRRWTTKEEKFGKK